MFEPKNTHVVHATTDETLPLIEQVKKHANVTYERAEFLVKFGSIYVENIRVMEDKLIKAGTYLRLHKEPRRYPVESIDWKARILEENSDFVVLNKPTGVPVPSTVENFTENVAYQLSQAIGHPLYVTSRLDRPTSGVLLLAKTKEFQSAFNKLLLQRKVEKKYVALTLKEVKPGPYSHFIEVSKTVPKKVAEEKLESYATAELIVESCQKLGNGTFESSIQLLTGRTHQIRAQFSYLGYPLLGDAPYGGEEVFGFNEKAIALRALTLKFLHYTFNVPSFSDELGLR